MTMLRLFVFLIAVAGFSACSGPRPVEREGELPTPAPATIDHSTYETFDPARYREEPPAVGTQDSVVHDVPSALLRNNSAEAGGSGVVYSGPGYRVQVFQSTDKDEADRQVNAAVAWWRQAAAERSLNRTPEVYTVYRAPYYRVRVGNFQTRDQARAFQAALGANFSGAFIVQDRVTVRQ